ncbi:cyclopropane mycolic acid synthase family methyltransferase [Smaragdicoccus niigatensis]|uniref:cyclopropane mycolic acid synthase family methyltransferase n=1 Tax=Smaragdicoccus niigatensis TaxID=359359 RepID=UPI000378D9DB|nr:cyclopropane mycolic acid synthase family methyltransferase [Smaragdicoccus niigatensis]
MTELQPFFKDVQTHYDLSDEFFNLFLDPTHTYSCAYFRRDDLTLEQAQLAKIDLALDKCDLRPGMTLLDIGCGWGAVLKRAVERYDVNVIGLTLSKNQHAAVNADLKKLDSTRHAEVRLQGWEEFNEKVDRIVSIGAFEHFRYERYDDFFNFAYSALPSDGSMLLHTITNFDRHTLRDRGIRLGRENLQFFRFIATEIFPGGQLPQPKQVIDGATAVGFNVERVHPLQQHYAKTLDIWAANLEARREDAIAIHSLEMYDRYMKYLTGCADHFRQGYIDVMQFTLRKSPWTTLSSDIPSVL